MPKLFGMRCLIPSTEDAKGKQELARSRELLHNVLSDRNLRRLFTNSIMLSIYHASFIPRGSSFQRLGANSVESGEVVKSLWPVALTDEILCVSCVVDFERHEPQTSFMNADVAQLVEHDLAKVDVEGSSPFVRFEIYGVNCFTAILP